MESGIWMMRAVWVALLALVSAVGSGQAQDRAGAFDYYVLALSWNASWCSAEGDARQADQCDPRYDHGFVLHGLWPQGERDWPEYCRTDARDPSRRETGEQADLFGSGGLAWHQWKKHGRCSGLSARQYFQLARVAYEKVTRPALLRQLTDPVRIDPDVVEAVFLEENQWLEDQAVRVTCRDGLIREVRICLNRSLEPRGCSQSVARHCPLGQALLPPMR